MNYKHLIISILILLLIPIAYAEGEEEEGPPKCGLTNLAICIPQKLFEFALAVVNAPLQPFLNMNKSLLSEPVNINPFMSIWVIIIYIISLFYGLLLMGAGFNFIISSYSDQKRESAKEWLKNVVIMIIAVQSSFFLYGLLIDISASMTAGILNMIDENFFLLTADSITNVFLEFFLAVPYLLTLITTLLFLSLRYLIVASGVVFFPLGLFFNFIPFLRSYGKLILNFLLVAIFLPFFQAIILLFGSLLVELPIFSGFKILVASTVFTLINLVFIFLVLFVIVKAAFSVMNSDMGRAATTIITRVPVPSSSAPNPQTRLDRFL